MIFNSIRWRLQIWYGLILVAVLAGFGATAYQLERGRVYRQVDDELQRRVGALASVLRQPPRNRGPEGRPGGGRPFDGPPEEQPQPDNPPPGRANDDGPPGQLPPGPREFRLPPQQARLFDETDTNGFYYVVWRRDGNELARSTNAPADVRMPPPPSRQPGRETENPGTSAVGRQVAVPRGLATRHCRCAACFASRRSSRHRAKPSWSAAPSPRNCPICGARL